jgi:hypothetical protein
MYLRPLCSASNVKCPLPPPCVCTVVPCPEIALLHFRLSLFVSALYNFPSNGSIPLERTFRMDRKSELKALVSQLMEEETRRQKQRAVVKIMMKLASSILPATLELTVILRQRTQLRTRRHFLSRDYLRAPTSKPSKIASTRNTGNFSTLSQFIPYI